MRRNCFVRDSLARVTHLAISGSGTDAIGLSLVQLLESCQRILRMLDVSAPLISLREIRVNRLVAGFKLPRCFQMRNRILQAASHQVNAAKGNLRSGIVLTLRDGLLQSRLRFREFWLTGDDAGANQGFAKNRQQRGIFVAMSYAFARGADCPRDVTFE